MWHITGEMLTDVAKVCVPIIITCLVLLFLIIFKGPKEKSVKIAFGIIPFAVLCYCGFVLAFSIFNYVDCNQRIEQEKAQEEKELKQKKGDPFLDYFWENDQYSVRVDNDQIGFWYYENLDDESADKFVLYGSFLRLDDEKAVPYIEKSLSLLEEYKDCLQEFYVLRIIPDKIKVNGEEKLAFEYDSVLYYIFVYVYDEANQVDYLLYIDEEHQTAECMKPHRKRTEDEWNFLKPIIYLYPESEMNISVKLSDPENITCDYPEYNDGWKVVAKPNGDLFDLNNGKKLYSLYYESEWKNCEMKDEGFVVKSAEVADFLDEKLEILGLNYKEREEFIVYWLPKLESNEYNYIRFLTEDEISDNIQDLHVDPKPDTIIRVSMVYKGLDKPISVTEQRLKQVERTGFAVVEWGGTELR